MSLQKGNGQSPARVISRMNYDLLPLRRSQHRTIDRINTPTRCLRSVLWT